MTKIGDMNRLEIMRTDERGYILDGGALGEIFLSSKQMATSYSAGDKVAVFVYLDSEDKPAATTRRPLARVGQFAHLEVVDVNPVGAFLDWGLPKHVLVPFDEQKVPMREGESHIVRLYLDSKTERIVATSKVDRFLKSENESFEPSEAVDLLVYASTDIGYKCIVNHSHWGILFYDDVFERLKIGQRIKGYIKQIREDSKINLCLNLPGYEGIEAFSEAIMETLRKEGGFIPLNDKSTPADIHARFGVSKQMFKRAVGALYKQRRITLEKEGIRSNEYW